VRVALHPVSMIRVSQTVHAVIRCFTNFSSSFVQFYATRKARQISAPYPPIDSVMRLMTVWRITGKIIRTAIFNTYRMHNYSRHFFQF